MPVDNEDDREDVVNPAAIEAALHQMAQQAREEAFAAGLAVMVIRSKRLVKLYPDGTVEDLGAISEPRTVVPQ